MKKLKTPLGLTLVIAGLVSFAVMYVDLLITGGSSLSDLSPVGKVFMGVFLLDLAVIAILSMILPFITWIIGLFKPKQ
jgi:hypothetical protein